MHRKKTHHHDKENFKTYQLCILNTMSPPYNGALNSHFEDKRWQCGLMYTIYIYIYLYFTTRQHTTHKQQKWILVQFKKYIFKNHNRHAW